jgi:hypothetical protein
MINKKMAIAIPTYNRADILEENLRLMLPEIMSLNISVYISDDSDNDRTEVMVNDLLKVYDNLFYFKNNPRLGHDRNCLSTLMKPDAEYIWYIGDSVIINNGALSMAMQVIAKDTFDFIVVGAENRESGIHSRAYQDENEFFHDLAWHATFTGATIYRKAILKIDHYQKYFNTNFIQLGILLEEMAYSEKGLYWINENCFRCNPKKGGSYWNNNIFKVFADDWCNFIRNLPEVYNNNKNAVIRSHSDHTGLFKLRNYLELRKNNILNIQSYRKYYDNLKDASSLKMPCVLILSMMPIFFIRFIISAGRLIKSTLRRK